MKSTKKIECSHLNRREFLTRAGVAGFSFTTISPLFFSLFRQKSLEAGTDPIPCKLIHIHLSGGWAGKHTFVARDQMGNIVDSSLFTDHYGIPSNQLSVSNGVSTALGAPMFDLLGDGVTPASFFTSNMLAQLNADALANTYLTTISTQSTNDNTPATIGGLSESIASILDQNTIKPLVAHMVGLTNSPSGNGVSSFLSYPSITRITPQSVNQLFNVVQFSQALGAAGATQAQLAAFAQGIDDYMAVKLGTFGKSTGETAFAAIQQASTTDLMGRVTPPPGFTPTALNPSMNAQVATLLGLSTNNFGSNPGDLMWTAIYNTLQGAYAMCAFQLGGYDYHGETGNSPDIKDGKAGDLVGRLIMLARFMNVATMIVITSDGSVEPTGVTGPLASGSASARWAGDNNNYVDWAMFLVRGGSINAGHLQSQLGSTAPDTGLNNTSSLVGVDKAATAAILRNWAHLNGLDSSVAGVLTSAGFDQTTISNIVANTVSFG